MKPWKSGESLDSTDLEACFNGATAMKPWKSPLCDPFYDHMAGFNGATAMKPWKSRELGCVHRLFLSLQWGHGDEAVEETSNVYQDVAGILLQWGHGDEAVEEARRRY